MSFITRSLTVSALLLGLLSRSPDLGAAETEVSKAQELAPNTAETIQVRKASANQESYERDVDRAALEAQESSIQKLQGLLKKYRGKRQEPTLLAKLAELQNQKASIRFRLAHGSAQRGGKSSNMAAYKQDMAGAIKTLTELIAKYPNYEEIQVAYFLRGKSYEEIENKIAATKDFLHLVKNFPEAEQCTAAYMSLADFAIGDNQHEKAITYLREVEKHPEDPKFPFALYKLAWSHYNLKQIPSALAYAEKQVSYYNTRRTLEPKGVLAVSDESFRENMLLDSTVFFLEGYEQKMEQFAVGEALPWFRKLESGPSLGKMLARYTKLLRSHGHEQDLMRFKDIVMKEESRRPEVLDILITIFEFQVGRRRYTQVQETAGDMITLYRKYPTIESWPKAQKLILDTADELQQIIVKNKAADDVSKLSTVLAGIYDSFTKLVAETDPRIPRVHYNLAETLFEIKDYEQATTHYRWVVTHGTWDAKAKGQATVADASLKAIGARYETLRARALIPLTIEAKSLQSTQLKPLEPSLGEWITWVDTHVKKTNDPIENFSFEASRSLYAQGHVLPAVIRLQEFAEDHPVSKFAIPSAALVLDSYLASQDWEKLHELATDFMKVKAWKTTEFDKRLFATAADAYYKTIESFFQKKDYPGALSRADKFLVRYGKSERFPDALFMAGSAALSLKDQDKAAQYFTRLIQEAPKADSVRAALLNRASIAEDRYQFGDASRDYKQYLRLPSLTQEKERKGDEPIREKTLVLAWLSGDQAEFRDTLTQKAVCTPSNESLCDKYQALLAIASRSLSEEGIKDAYEKARKGIEANRTLWAIAALGNSKPLSFHNRLNIIRQVAGNWEEIDPLLRFALIPEISQSIPKAMQLNRADLPGVAPLRANPKWIARRVEVIKELELTATKAMKLPWSRVRAHVLNEMGGVYIDLAKGIQGLPAPKDLPEADLTAYEDTVRKLVIPFEEKGQEMRTKAFEIASRFAIDDESYASISEPYFLDNPSLTKRLKPQFEPKRPQSLDTVFLTKLDPEGDWDDLELKSNDGAMRMKANWADALQKKNWAKVGFFLFQAQSRNLMPKPVLSAVRSVSLAAAGARGEALSELDDARKELGADSKKVATLYLMNHYFCSLSRERTKELLVEFFRMDPETDVAVRGPKDAPPADGRTPASNAPAAKPGLGSRNPIIQLISNAAEWAGV